MIPGISRNWRRTSKTIAPAARVTALMARPEKRNTTAQPRSRPTRVLGVTTWRSNIDWTYLLGSSVSSLPSMIRRSSLCQASLYEPNSAVAARTAVAMAMPLVIALVVLPTASRSVRICAPSPSTSPDISAMPWALSGTGPKVSMATMTPTVVSRPQPARAIRKSDSEIEPPPRRNAR